MLKQFAIDAAIVLGIPAMVVVAYYTVMGPEATTLLTFGTPSGVYVGDTGPTPGSRSQNLLSQLSGLAFDESIFQDPTFWALTDFSVPIATSTLGRDYPFTPPDEVLELNKFYKRRENGEVPQSMATKEPTSTPKTTPKK